MLIHDHRNRVGYPILAALAAVGVMASGCSETSDLAARYAVSGKVTYKGELVKRAVINFMPTTPGGRGATGQIEDGFYKLTTQDPGDGAIPGKYKITVDDRQPDEEKIKEKTAALARKTKMKPGGVIPQEFQAAALKQAKGTLPAKYQVASTSDIEVEVKPQSNTIDISLND
jgi:hypothetical protein